LKVLVSWRAGEEVGVEGMGVRRRRGGGWRILGVDKRMIGNIYNSPQPATPRRGTMLPRARTTRLNPAEHLRTHRRQDRKSFAKFSKGPVFLVQDSF
jgi:hypothetical protein